MRTQGKPAPPAPTLLTRSPTTSSASSSPSSFLRVRSPAPPSPHQLKALAAARQDVQEALADEIAFIQATREHMRDYQRKQDLMRANDREAARCNDRALSSKAEEQQLAQAFKMRELQKERDEAEYARLLKKRAEEDGAVTGKDSVTGPMLERLEATKKQSRLQIEWVKSLPNACYAGVPTQEPSTVISTSKSDIHDLADGTRQRLYEKSMRKEALPNNSPSKTSKKESEDANAKWEEREQMLLEELKRAKQQRETAMQAAEALLTAREREKEKVHRAEESSRLSSSIQMESEHVQSSLLEQKQLILQQQEQQLRQQKQVDQLQRALERLQTQLQEGKVTTKIKVNKETVGAEDEEGQGVDGKKGPGEDRPRALDATGSAQKHAEFLERPGDGIDGKVPQPEDQAGPVTAIRRNPTARAQRYAPPPPRADTEAPAGQNQGLCREDAGTDAGRGDEKGRSDVATGDLEAEPDSLTGGGTGEGAYVEEEESTSEPRQGAGGAVEEKGLEMGRAEDVNAGLKSLAGGLEELGTARAISRGDTAKQGPAAGQSGNDALESTAASINAENGHSSEPLSERMSPCFRGPRRVVVSMGAGVGAGEVEGAGGRSTEGATVNNGQQLLDLRVQDDQIFSPQAGGRKSPSASPAATHPIIDVLFGYDKGPGIGGVSPSKYGRAPDTKIPRHGDVDASTRISAVESPLSQGRFACASCRFFGIERWCANNTSAVLQDESMIPANRSKLDRFRALPSLPDADLQNEATLLAPVSVHDAIETGAGGAGSDENLALGLPQGHASVEWSAWELALVQAAEDAVVGIVPGRSEAIFLPEVDMPDFPLDGLSEIRKRDDDEEDVSARSKHENTTPRESLEDGDLLFELSALDMQVRPPQQQRVKLKQNGLWNIEI